ncbi:acylglycerol kinase family protein [Komagataeibacter rhaeticus]|nr:acylglycerol kinase family protein [Komagataeibacter rhaeticus]
MLARDAAGAGRYTHIVAAGGDGTVAEVADGMAGSDIILGILPVGTANVLASELGIPADAAGNARIIAAGDIRSSGPAGCVPVPGTVCSCRWWGGV